MKRLQRLVFFSLLALIVSAGTMSATTFPHNLERKEEK